MQALDLPCNPSIDAPAPDPSAMPEHNSPIHPPDHHSSKEPENERTHVESNTKNESSKENSVKNSSVSKNNDSNSVVVRRERPSRACTQRAAARMQAAAEAEAAMAEAERKKKARKRERLAARLLREESEEEELEEEEVKEEENGEEDGSPSSRLQCSKIVTPLVGELEPSQLPRWNIRSMWQLASILNFLNVFRPLLNIKVEFSAEEFETALITPNSTLGDVHMPLLKAIPPVTRMALSHSTWVTVLCRKLRDWWHWVAEGDLPIVASHGAEFEAYNALDPGVRVVILKALCDIRVEQDDIRSYIEDSIKHGVHLSAFRKERIGGDSHGVSYWYEEDPIIGHRLYREIRKVEVKKGKGKNIPPIPHSSYQWEAVATNLDEFLNVSEKLFSSKNRTEVSVGKKLKNNMLPEIEKVHKRKEKLLKKQHRQAMMLDSMMSIDGLGAGRSLRDRKPVTYTFDAYDRSINEALKVTKKKQPSPEPCERRDPLVKREFSTNGRWGGPSQYSRHDSFSAPSPDNDELYDDQKTETLDRSNRWRQRPQRYSVKEYVEAVSDNEADFDSDDDIVGEVVYDDEYLRRRKQRRKTSSSSEGDEEYHWDEENTEEEEEEEDNDSLSTSVESDKPRRLKRLPGRTRRETKLRSVDDLQSGLRRSKRATRNRINYKQYEMSESETELMKPEMSNALDENSDESDNAELSTGSQDSEENINKQEIHANEPPEERPEMVDKKQTGPLEQSNSREEAADGVRERHFLDLNELAPGSGFDDGPTSMRDEDTDDL
ncbi:DDT domain-containing protein DDR4 [Sesamum alatum]|uniref:DDT domain-containing protein DDR4 n=1 Tax=Sesamum alatum TaxID=300844 RepID=A0AAE1YVR5_9LAMI|nr:DDT domain-containing protein DDR4 [Sesamum alatum]